MRTFIALSILFCFSSSIGFAENGHGLFRPTFLPFHDVTRGKVVFHDEVFEGRKGKWPYIEIKVDGKTKAFRLSRCEAPHCAVQLASCQGGEDVEVQGDAELNPPSVVAKSLTVVRSGSKLLDFLAGRWKRMANDEDNDDSISVGSMPDRSLRNWPSAFVNTPFLIKRGGKGDFDTYQLESEIGYPPHSIWAGGQFNFFKGTLYVKGNDIYQYHPTKPVKIGTIKNNQMTFSLDGTYDEHGEFKRISQRQATYTLLPNMKLAYDESVTPLNPEKESQVHSKGKMVNPVLVAGIVATEQESNLFRPEIASLRGKFVLEPTQIEGQPGHWPHVEVNGTKYKIEGCKPNCQNDINECKDGTDCAVAGSLVEGATPGIFAHHFSAATATTQNGSVFTYDTSIPQFRDAWRAPNGMIFPAHEIDAMKFLSKGEAETYCESIGGFLVEGWNLVLAKYFAPATKRGKPIYDDEAAKAYATYDGLFHKKEGFGSYQCVFKTEDHEAELNTKNSRPFVLAEGQSLETEFPPGSRVELPIDMDAEAKYAKLPTHEWSDITMWGNHSCSIRMFNFDFDKENNYEKFEKPDHAGGMYHIVRVPAGTPLYLDSAITHKDSVELFFRDANSTYFQMTCSAEVNSKKLPPSLAALRRWVFDSEVLPRFGGKDAGRRNSPDQDPFHGRTVSSHGKAFGVLAIDLDRWPDLRRDENGDIFGLTSTKLVRLPMNPDELDKLAKDPALAKICAQAKDYRRSPLSKTAARPSELLRKITESTEDHLEAVKTLGNYTDQASELAPALMKLIEGKYPDPTALHEIGKTLAKYGQAGTQVVEKAMHSADTRTRMSVPYLLSPAGIFSAEKSMQMLNTLANDHELAVRLHTIQALANFSAEEAFLESNVVPVLENAIGDKDNDVRHAAIETLETLLGKEKAEERRKKLRNMPSYWIKLLEATEAEVRAKAVHELANSREDISLTVPPLIEALGQKDKVYDYGYENVRGEVWDAIKAKGTAAGPYVEKAIHENDNAKVQRRLARLVGSGEIFPPEKSAELLFKMAEKSNSVEPVEQLVRLKGSKEFEYNVKLPLLRKIQAFGGNWDVTHCATFNADWIEEKRANETKVADKPKIVTSNAAANPVPKPVWNRNMWYWGADASKPATHYYFNNQWVPIAAPGDTVQRGVTFSTNNGLVYWAPGPSQKATHYVKGTAWVAVE